MHNKNVEIRKIENLDSILNKLRQVVIAKRLKTSRQREEILSLIYNSKVHLSPEDIAIIMKSSNKDTSISSIYRILQFLETYGFITSIDMDKSSKRYEIAAKEHHYHIICLGCGQIFEFVDDEVKDKQKAIANSLKCKLVSYNLRLFVICDKCQNSEIHNNIMR